MERSDADRPPVLDYAAPRTPMLRPGVRSWVAGLLVIVGIQCWLIFGRSDYGRNIQLKLLLATLILGLIPPVNRLFGAFLDRIRRPSPQAMWITAVTIAILSALYFPFTGWYQGRNFMPKWQDELSYMIQFQMLSHGRLWMPQHPLADFFDSFQLLVKPVYASIYFPGAALMYTPMKWLGLPYWIASAAATGVVVGLVYLIMTELIDGVAGVLGVLLMIGCDMLRKLSLMIGGHPPILLIGTLMIYCWLRWRRSPRPAGWAIAIGVLAGWAAITRPLDAIVFALPIGIDMLLCLRGQPLKRWLTTGASLVFPALPFLTVQLVFNIGVTG
ncbi:MAG TPA: glycosyltransferase family 39 protein, partial [Tepidisphaeraceae bacterium]